MTIPASVSDLSDHVEWLKREVAIPGTFDATYPETTEDLLAASLADGFAAAQLDLWFPTNTVDLTDFTITPALSTAGLALVILYAGTRFIQAELKNRPTRTNYDAGGVKAETEFAPTVMVERLKELQATKDRLLALAKASERHTVVYMQDGYALRVAALYPGERSLYDSAAAFRQIQSLRQ